MSKVRIIPVTAIVLLGAALAAFGSFEFSPRVYRWEDIDKAYDEARQKRKPITFIYTRESSSCGLCRYASLNAAEVLKQRTVTVYVDTNTDFSRLPKVLQRALQSEAAGTFIPKTVVVSPDGSEVLAIVPYARGKEHDALLKEAKRSIAKAMRETTASESSSRPGPTVLMIPADESRESREWTSVGGSTLQASLVSEKDSYLILQREDGSRVTIHIQRLSAKDRDYVQTLKAGLSP